MATSAHPLHPVPALVWLLWALAAATSVQLAPNPLYVTLVIAISALVVEGHAVEGPLRGAFPVLLIAGIAFAVLRLVLTALTTHGTGDVLFFLPEGTLPALLGGFTVGGTVEAPVVARAAAEGWALVGILAAFGAFNAVVSHHELVAVAPRAFYEVGLAITVAIAFVPSTIAAVGAVRESDRARTGGRVVRRGRLLRQVVPILETGMERAVGLAESMDSRGFGHAPASRADATAGWLSLASLLALGASFVALVGRANGIAVVLLVAGTLGVVAAVVVASRASRRVRYRRRRLTPGDWGLAGAAWAAPVALIALTTFDDATLVWPGDRLGLPGLNVLAVAALAALALPALRTRNAAGVIRYHAVSFAYPDGAEALRGVDLEVDAGEVLLVAGSSGSGKSTLLRAANGLVPHATGGRFSGMVTAFGRATSDHPPRAMADVVGFVHQDPEAQFVVDQVEADLAFVLENLGTDEATMRRRVEEVLDALDIAHLRDRSPATLSGGERQRCAIAGALAAAPAALVLDEPTSQLDPQGAEDVLAALARLNADLGTTVVLAEHRLERAAPMADRAVIVDGGVVSVPDRPAAVLAHYPGAPSVTRLGRLLGWRPLPLTVKEARAHTRPPTLPDEPVARPPAAPGDRLVRARGITVDLGGRRVLHGLDVDVHRGEVVALLGRNGSGKTTLLRALASLQNVAAGEVTTFGPAAYVPQDPNSLLFAPTVRRELEQTLRLLGRSDREAIDRWLARLGLTALADRHPRSLSGGERQRVAVAAVAVGGADLLLLDEPTRGMDAASRAALEDAVAQHAAGGGAVVLATHDIELAARAASRAVVLGAGDVVADGPARSVLAGSLFAPQVLRVLPPYLTVEEVAATWTG